MAVFIVVPIHGEERLATQLSAKMAGKYFKLPRGEYLVSYAGTSRQLSDELDITSGDSGSAFVASLSGYFGRAPTDTWEWIKQHWGSEV